MGGLVLKCADGGGGRGGPVPGGDRDRGPAQPGRVVDVDGCYTGGHRGGGQLGEHREAEARGDQAQAGGPFAYGTDDPRAFEGRPRPELRIAPESLGHDPWFAREIGDWYPTAVREPVARRHGQEQLAVEERVAAQPVEVVGGQVRSSDAEQPPLRILLGKSFGDVGDLYEQRLRTWREWQPVSVDAFG